ncbi:hypothetical protein TNIN_218971 [Trichonephila inaurata madagascariensis]|uniref:Uncharacterized protein n=1 Tax=Trichonephila inaurata madagascariensis TaxID=2747483 RepID=A0A8X6XFL1_9ARAC|nr:hypothetical protein TNIN_218971 [Trichonephila inaurata madagascariensis]
MARTRSTCYNYYHSRTNHEGKGHFQSLSFISRKWQEREARVTTPTIAGRIMREKFTSKALSFIRRKWQEREARITTPTIAGRMMRKKVTAKPIIHKEEMARTRSTCYNIYHSGKNHEEKGHFQSLSFISRKWQEQEARVTTPTIAGRIMNLIFITPKPKPLLICK